MFHVSVVFKRIRKRVFGNTVTIAVILVGALLLMFSLNILIDIRRQNSEFLNNSADNTYTISSRNIPGDPQTHFISEDQLGKLHSVSGLHINVSINYNIVTFAGRSHFENDEEVVDKYIVAFSESVSEVYAEEEFAEVLPYLNNKNTINFGDVDFGSIDIYDTFDDGEKYIHSCVMPLDRYWKDAKPSSFSEFILTAVCENPAAYENIPQLIEILSNTNEYEFFIGNEFYDFLSKASFAEQALSKIIFFSAMLLIVVFISTICVFLCLIDERAFEIAVCRAVGASIVTVFLEFFSELLIISLVPAFASILANILLFKNGIDFFCIFVSNLNFIAAVLGVAGILIVDGICIIPIAFKLRFLKPYELLTVEG